MKRIPNYLASFFARIAGVRIGSGLRFYGVPVIHKSNNSSISIGNNCIINSSFLSNLAGMYQRSVLVARDGGTISIGHNTGLSAVTIYSCGSITIGDNCLIGVSIKMFDHDFHPADPIKRLEQPDLRIPKAVILGDNVFVRGNLLILKGVTFLRKKCYRYGFGGYPRCLIKLSCIGQPC